jgi:hypothetical protein
LKKLFFCGIASVLAFHAVVQAQTTTNQQPEQWVPGPGLWTMSGKMMNMSVPALKFCSDGKTVSDIFGMNGQRKETAQKQCQFDAPVKSADGVSHRQVCKMDEAGSTVETTSSIKGDNKTKFNVAMISNVKLKGSPEQTIEMNMSGTLSAAKCPANMKAGDLMMPDGQVVSGKK